VHIVLGFIPVWLESSSLHFQNATETQVQGLSFKSEYPLCSWIDLIYNTNGSLCVYCSRVYTSVMEFSSLCFWNATGTQNAVVLYDVSLLRFWADCCILEIYTNSHGADEVSGDSLMSCCSLLFMMRISVPGHFCGGGCWKVTYMTTLGHCLWFTFEILLWSFFSAVG
jgi:hypothetical protein